MVYSPAGLLNNTENGKNEKKNFYHIALGFLTELQNQLLVSKDLGYIEKNSFTQSAIQTVEVSKLINGLIKSLNT